MCIRDRCRRNEDRKKLGADDVERIRIELLESHLSNNPRTESLNRVQLDERPKNLRGLSEGRTPRREIGSRGAEEWRNLLDEKIHVISKMGRGLLDRIRAP